MLVSSLLVLSSFLSAFAAPIPFQHRRAHIEARDSGWPHSTNGDAEKSAFGVSGGFENSYLQEVDGSPMLVANYPEGSYAGAAKPDPGIGGFIFEADGQVSISDAKVVSFKYQVKFPSGFEFAEAGKLPGLYGGDDDTIAKTCAGGHHNDACWSARLMWRKDGKGELYGYLPTANNNKPFCPSGGCNPKYGASIDTGAWTFVSGDWTSVEERVTLNDPGKENGEIEVLIGGESKIHITGVVLRSSDKGRTRGAMMHTFFGGSSSPIYKSPKKQEAYFKDFSIEVTEKLPPNGS